MCRRKPIGIRFIDGDSALCIVQTVDVMAVYRALGRAVAARRGTLKWTQAELAERVGTSRASIANIEAGRQKVLLHQVYSLVQALELRSVTDLAPDRHVDVSGEANDAGLDFWGAALSDAQRAGAERLLASALASDAKASK